MQKGKKFVTFALISTYGTNMVVHKEGVHRDGTIDEKVTVISSFSTLLYFFKTEAGNALAALGNIHEGDSHIIK